MKIGNLIIEIYAELLEKQSIEILQNLMYQPLVSVSDKFDFDYKRFGYFAATLIWVVPLKIFWKNDQIYKTLKSGLDKYFTNWKVNVTLTIHEKGD